MWVSNTQNHIYVHFDILLISVFEWRMHIVDHIANRNKRIWLLVNVVVLLIFYFLRLKKKKKKKPIDQCLTWFYFKSS